MKSLELLKKLTTTPGVSGHERKIAQIIDENLSSTRGEKIKDNIGGVAYSYQGDEKGPKIMFIAHQDEVGFMVAGIMSNGLLRIHNIGGWDPTTLKSSPVEVYNRKGEKYYGIIGSIPVHHQKANGNGGLSIDGMFVDIGAFSKEEVINDFKINLGDPIVPVSNFHYQEKNNLIFSKAFDDRIGIAAIIELGQYLDKESHPNTIFCAGSVQEEVGTRGAATITNTLNPDLAVVIEGPPADDFPGNESNAQTKLGNGLHIRLYDPTMIPKFELKNFVCDLAEKMNIPYQVTVRKGGGTDGKIVHLTNSGIPSIVIGAPVRYAHSHNGVMSLNDYENMLKLAKAICKELDNEKAQEILV